MHYGCNGGISKAHTIPKSSSLNEIAREGHVLGLKFDLELINKNQGKLRPEPIGINRASTFTGFCKAHDDSLFAPLEKTSFSSSEEQCFLLAFRSFSRENYTKNALVEMHELNSLMDRGQPLERQIEVQEFSGLLNLGAVAGKNDNEFHKGNFDECLESGEYSRARAISFEFAETFPIQASGAVNPDFDFNGEKIQDLSDLSKTPDLMSVTSFFDGEHSFVVFSWLDYCHTSNLALLNTLLAKPEEEIPALLAQYIFSNLENFYLSPSWWEGLSSEDQDEMINMSLDNADPFEEPHGRSISRKILKCDLPEIHSVQRVNW